MNKRGFRLGRLLGIEIYIDYSWILIFLILVFVFSNLYIPEALKNLPEYEYFILGFLITVLFFASSFLHELMHSIVAIKNNVKVKRITLFLFGGMSELFEEPKNAEEEFKIAIAGPATSLGLSLLFGFLWFLSNKFFNSPIFSLFTSTLFEINLILCIFNLLPGFPLDGGRILRSLLWVSSKDLKKATKIATTGGQVMAMFIIFFGIMEVLISGQWSGIWLILIGLFLNQAANQNYIELEIRDTLRDIPVLFLMNKNILSLSPNLSIDDALTEYFIKYISQSFPVLENDRIVGLVSLNDIRKKRYSLSDSSRIRDVMRPFPEELAVEEDSQSVDALKIMIEREVSFLPVKKNTTIVGMITLEEIANFLAEKKAI